MASIKGIGGLGKGLSALIPIDQDKSLETGEPRQIAISNITASPFQPRRDFDEEKLNELADSIKRHGVVQPILLRDMGEEAYQIIAGERRFRAAQLAGLTTIPAFLKDLADGEMAEIALIENIQREDLNPVEEAMAYKRLAEEFSLTQEQIAKRVSKSRSAIANSLRLLNLPAEILNTLGQGVLTTGHVRPLLTLPETEAQRLAQEMVEKKATVREAEVWARNAADSLLSVELVDITPTVQSDAMKETSISAPSSDLRNSLPIELKEIQRVLREAIETKVEITHGAKGGKVIIEYYSQDDLERILNLITGSRELHN